MPSLIAAAAVSNSMASTLNNAVCFAKVATISSIPVRAIPVPNSNKLILAGPCIVLRTASVAQHLMALKQGNGLTNGFVLTNNDVTLRCTPPVSEVIINKNNLPPVSVVSGPTLLRCRRRPDIGKLGLPETKPISVSRRNARERNRVKLVNQGFNILREHVPNGRKNRKMSKVDTLKSAVEYIRRMTELLREDDEKTFDTPEFSSVGIMPSPYDEVDGDIDQIDKGNYSLSIIANKKNTISICPSSNSSYSAISHDTNIYGDFDNFMYRESDISESKNDHIIYNSDTASAMANTDKDVILERNHNQIDNNNCEKFVNFNMRQFTEQLLSVPVLSEGSNQLKAINFAQPNNVTQLSPVVNKLNNSTSFHEPIDANYGRLTSEMSLDTVQHQNDTRGRAAAEDTMENLHDFFDLPNQQMSTDILLIQRASQTVPEISDSRRITQQSSYNNGRQADSLFSYIIASKDKYPKHSDVLINQTPTNSTAKIIPQQTLMLFADAVAFDNMSPSHAKPPMSNSVSQFFFTSLPSQPKYVQVPTSPHSFSELTSLSSSNTKTSVISTLKLTTKASFSPSNAVITYPNDLCRVKREKDSRGSATRINNIAVCNNSDMRSLNIADNFLNELNVLSEVQLRIPPSRSNDYKSANRHTISTTLYDKDLTSPIYSSAHNQTTKNTMSTLTTLHGVGCLSNRNLGIHSELHDQKLIQRNENADIPVKLHAMKSNHSLVAENPKYIQQQSQHSLAVETKYHNRKRQDICVSFEHKWVDNQLEEEKPVSSYFTHENGQPKSQPWCPSGVHVTKKISSNQANGLVRTRNHVVTRTSFPQCSSGFSSQATCQDRASLSRLSTGSSNTLPVISHGAYGESTTGEQQLWDISKWITELYGGGVEEIGTYNQGKKLICISLC